MCQQKACLIALVLVLSLGNHVQAGLSRDPSVVLHYSFDAISDIVVDQSGNGHNGVVEGDIVLDPGGISNGAAKFAQGSYIDLKGLSFQIDITAWGYCVRGHEGSFLPWWVALEKYECVPGPYCRSTGDAPCSSDSTISHY